MPDEEGKTINILNSSKMELLHKLFQVFRGENKSNSNFEQIPQIDTINRVPNQSTLEDVPMQKPSLPKNRYGRPYYGYMVFDPNGVGPKIIENGGSI